MAHELHRLLKAIRDKFSNVDLLVFNTNKVFSKAPSRVDTFKEKCPNLSVPPQPIITRWRTWLDAAFYYGKNFDKVKEVIDTFNPNDASSIQNAQQLFNDNSIKNELSKILSNFQCITDAHHESRKIGCQSWKKSRISSKCRK